MAPIGKVTTIFGESVLEWKIMNFFALSKKPDKVYYSPDFYLGNDIWYFSIYPNGQWQNNSVGFIGLCLCRESDGPDICLEYSFSLKTQDGKIDKEIQFTDRNFFMYTGDDWGYGVEKFLNRSELLQRQHELAPSNILSVVCTIKQLEFTECFSDDGVTSKCTYCQIALEEDVDAHQEKCLDKPIKCPQCSDVIPLKNWYEHKCQKTEAKGLSDGVTSKCSYCQIALEADVNAPYHQKKCPQCGNVIPLKNWYEHKCQETGTKVSEKLLDDLKEMMLNGEHSDTVIKVKGEEFRLHKNILAVRNPFFQAMYKSDMKESITGAVKIDDCEPDAFRSFIHFVYTGKVDKLSPETVCDLYEVAAKYQEDQLKEECEGFMANIMSVENVCDFILLALRHDIKKLLQDSTEYFCSKAKEIVRSVKWQTFLVQYPTQAPVYMNKSFKPF